MNMNDLLGGTDNNSTNSSTTRSTKTETFLFIGLDDGVRFHIFMFFEYWTVQSVIEVVFINIQTDKFKIILKNYYKSIKSHLPEWQNILSTVRDPFLSCQLNLGVDLSKSVSSSRVIFIIMTSSIILIITTTSWIFFTSPRPPCCLKSCRRHVEWNFWIKFGKWKWLSSASEKCDIKKELLNILSHWIAIDNININNQCISSKQYSPIDLSVIEFYQILS